MSHKHSKKKEKHQDLTGEQAVSDIGQIVLACLFMAAWLGDSIFFKYTIFLNRYVPPGARIPVGAVVLALSGYLARKGLSTVFGKEREKPVVIRESVFNIVRHPVYLSEILLYFGLLILSISLAAAAVWIIAIGFLHYISRYEERMLVERFGGEYEQYMREVPMWIPRLRKK